jgi:hypothetical protein
MVVRLHPDHPLHQHRGMTSGSTGAARTAKVSAATDLTRVTSIWIEETGQGDDNIRRNQQAAF